MKMLTIAMGIAAWASLAALAAANNDSSWEPASVAMSSEGGNLPAANVPRGFAKNLALVASPGSDRVRRETVVEALFAVATELHVADRPMPRIVVVSATRQDAAASDADAAGPTRVFVVKHAATGETVYEAWIVHHEETKLVQVVVAILNDAFSLRLTPGESDKVALRIYAREKQLVSVRALEAKRK
jgi:hypothetical protein